MHCISEYLELSSRQVYTLQSALIRHSMVFSGPASLLKSVIQHDVYLLWKGFQMLLLYVSSASHESQHEIYVSKAGSQIVGVGYSGEG